MDRREAQKLFAPLPFNRESREGRKYCALFWSIDSFLEGYEELWEDFLPAILVLSQLLENDRAECSTSAYQEYLRRPLPDDRTGKFSSRKAQNETLRQASEKLIVPPNPDSVRGTLTLFHKLMEGKE
jgi:hypothetical protein